MQFARSKDLESVQDRIGEISSEAPTDTVHEKAAETTDESQESEEPA
jgi:hypothetical protein